MRQGRGVLNMVGGDVLEAAWAGDTPLSPVTHTTADGEHYVGGWSQVFIPFFFETVDSRIV